MVSCRYHRHHRIGEDRTGSRRGARSHRAPLGGSGSGARFARRFRGRFGRGAGATAGAWVATEAPPFLNAQGRGRTRRHHRGVAGLRGRGAAVLGGGSSGRRGSGHVIRAFRNPPCLRSERHSRSDGASVPHLRGNRACPGCLCDWSWARRRSGGRNPPMAAHGAKACRHRCRCSQCSRPLRTNARAIRCGASTADAASRRNESTACLLAARTCESPAA